MAAQSAAAGETFKLALLNADAIPITHREKRKTNEDTLQHPASTDIKCTVKKVSDIPVPSRDVTYQSLPGLGRNN